MGSWRRVGAFVLAFAAFMGVASPARAEWTVGGRVGLILPFREPETNVGWSAGVSGGYRFHVAKITLGPEIGGEYGVYTPIASARKAVGAFYGGARLGLDFVPILTPYAFTRIGFGVASTTNLPDPNQVKTLATGAYVDLGLGLSRRITRAFELGFEAGYATVEPGNCFCARWVHAGATGTFVF